MTVAVKSPLDADAQATVAELVRRARAAMAEFADADQARVDLAVTALAWSLYNPDHAKELAELAVADTKLGNVPDKIIKKQRKTFGTLRDLMRVKSVGIIEEDPARGIVKYAKPVGVVAAITPSTNPGATPVNKAMFAVKGRNAVIIAASPAGINTTMRTVDYMRAELKKIRAPQDLVQILPPPASKDMTQALMQAADLVVATGSQDPGSGGRQPLPLLPCGRRRDAGAAGCHARRRSRRGRRGHRSVGLGQVDAAELPGRARRARRRHGARRRRAAVSTA